MQFTVIKFFCIVTTLRILIKTESAQKSNLNGFFTLNSHILKIVSIILFNNWDRGHER